MSGIGEVLGIASAITALLGVAKKLQGTFEKVSTNQGIYYETTQHIVETIEDFEKLYQDRQDRIDASDLRESLSRFSIDLEVLYNKSTKVFKERKGIAVLKTYAAQWVKSDDIKEELARVDKKIERCYHRLLLSSTARIELGTLEIQDTLRDIQAHLHERVSSAQQDDKKADDMIRVSSMSEPEIKTALRKASMDLSKENVDSEEANYLRLKVRVLEGALHSLPPNPKREDAAAHFTLFHVTDMGDISYEVFESLGSSDNSEDEDPTREREDAVMETLRITRRLQDSRTSLSLIEVRFALDRLGKGLAKIGMWEEALIIAEREVEISRALKKEYSPAFWFILAASLCHLSNCLAHLGRKDDSLPVLEEAVELSRQPAEDLPITFKPTLALFLLTMSEHLTELGRDREASGCVAEAVLLLKKLTEDHPTKFKPFLGHSLEKLCKLLLAAGFWPAALQSIEEALEVFRPLAQERPDLFKPNLANSLGTLAYCLNQACRRNEALKVVEEAVGVFRELAQDRPSEFKPNLAVTLNNLSRGLGEEGRKEEALPLSREAADLYGELAEGNPDKFNPFLVSALENHSLLLRDLGRNDEALEYINSAIKVYGVLGKDHAKEYMARFSTALITLWGLSGCSDPNLLYMAMALCHAGRPHQCDSSDSDCCSNDTDDDD